MKKYEATPVPEEPSAKIIQFPRPVNMSVEQEDYMRLEAAKWGEIEETLYQQYEYAKGQREYYLRMMGMLAGIPGVRE